MKKTLAISGGSFAVLAALIAAVALSNPNPETAPAPDQWVVQPKNTAVAQVGNCDSSLWQFVYHPNRLPTRDDCRTVKGIVMWDKAEPDGDYHIRLQLDDPNSAPVNDKNIGGYLVVEPICQNAPTQQDAIQPCSGYTGGHWQIPAVGSHLEVTGFYTLDAQHGWMEIHAVSELDPIAQ